MPSTPRLAPGGREIIEQLRADLADVRDAMDLLCVALTELRHWNKQSEKIDVARLSNNVEAQALSAVKAAQRAERRLQEHLEPMLQRRESRHAQDDALAELRREVEAIKAQLASPAETPAPAPHVRIVSKGGRAGS